MSKYLEFFKKYNILILVVLGCLLYFPSLFYDFVYDDIPFLVNNQYLNGRVSIHFFDFFKPNFVMNSIYTPLTFIICWGIVKIFGISSIAFHFVNIIFYVLSSVILFYLLKRIINNDLISFFSTVLYILHPCHIECTAWVSALGYNIGLLFFLLSFLFFVLAFDKNKKIYYLFSVFSYVLSILGQPIAITLPAIIFLWVFLFEKDRLKESIIPIVFYLPFLFLYLFLYRQSVLMNGRFVSVSYNFFEKLSFLGFDLCNCCIPFNLCLIKSQPSLFFGLFLLLFLIFFIYFRKNKIILFFNCFAIIMILPYSNIFFCIDNPIVERYLLLFSISFCVFISYLSFYIFEKFKEKSLIKNISFIFFVVLYLILFIFYLPVWKTDKTLWTYVYKMNINNYNISAVYSKIFYSKILIENRQYDEALSVINKIIEYNSDYIDSRGFIDVYGFKITILMNINKIEEAMDICYKVEKKFPDNFKTYLYFFDVYMALKDYNKVLEVFNIAEQKCKKANLYTNNNLIILIAKKIKLDFVLAHPDEYIESLKILTNNFNLLQGNNELCKILENKDYKYREDICLNYLKKYNNRYSQSIIFLLSCLYMEETYKENASKTMKFLLEDMDKAQEFTNKGDTNSAEKLYLSIISKNKYMYQAYCNLGILYMQSNKREKAKDIFIKVLNINPNDGQIRKFYNSL